MFVEKDFGNFQCIDTHIICRYALNAFFVDLVKRTSFACVVCFDAIVYTIYTNILERILV